MNMKSGLYVIYTFCDFCGLRVLLCAILYATLFFTYTIDGMKAMICTHDIVYTDYRVHLVQARTIRTRVQLAHSGVRIV